MPQYDIIIAGAGPAGLGAAITASARGLKTALIERRAHLSPLTRACSEGLLYEEVYNGDGVRVNREAGRIEFIHCGFSLTYTGPVREVPCFINISPSGAKMKMVRFDHKPMHLVFDKARFLEENLEAAVSGGITFFPDQTVLGVERSTDAVAVTTSRQTFTGRFLIAADGHNSLCARLSGFSAGRQFYGTLSNACWHITGFDPPAPDHIHFVEGKGGPAVFCLCPRFREGEYNVMVSGFSPRPGYDATFQQVRTTSPLAPFFKGPLTVKHRLGCILNLFSPLENPCRDNIFVVGDGAWIGQSSNTHGALMGMKAAECIAEALTEKKQGEDIYGPYRSWWRKAYYHDVRPPGANMFEELAGGELDLLFSFMPPEIEGSLEPGTARVLMGALFQKLLPEIQKKHPELVAKIAAIQGMAPDEAWREKRTLGFPGTAGSIKTAA